MKKSDGSNSRSQEDSSVAVHGLRRFNLQQGMSLSSSNATRNCKGIEVSATSRSMYQNSRIRYSPEDDVDATYFWNHDDVKWTENNTSLLRSATTSNYAAVEPSSSMSSTEVNHSRADESAPKRLQKIIPCGYTPNRFPVTVTSAPHSCWPKTYHETLPYTFSGTITLPSTRIVPDSQSMAEPAPSTSNCGTSSVNEQIIYQKSSSSLGANPKEKSQTLLVGLFRRLENGTNTSGVL